MAEITAKAVKSLRDQTGAGMMDCKKALSETDGDLQEAVKVLRERGLSKAGKREGRATSEGAIGIILSGNCGGMVELGCETDFVARTDDYIGLCDSLTQAVVANAGATTPEALLEVDIDGQKAGDRVSAAIATLGENVVVKRVARLEVDGGVVGGYVHAGGKLGVLVALGGSTDEGIAKDVAMHVAAHDPTPVAVDRDGISAELIASEREIFKNQALQEGKPEKIVDKIVEGKINKFLSEMALVDQAFVKDPDKKVKDLLGSASVTSFERFKLGEGAEG